MAAVQRLSAVACLSGLLSFAACDQAPSIEPVNQEQPYRVVMRAVPTPIGLWAEELPLCASAPWEVARTKLTIASGETCTLGGVAATSRRWAGQAQCPDGRAGVAVFTKAPDGGGSLTFTGTAFAEPVHLVRC